MQPYQNYLNPQTQAVQPMYPNYNFQSQNPYIDRFVQNQQAQQMNQMQNQPVQQIQGLNGRIVYQERRNGNPEESMDFQRNNRHKPF